MFFEDIVLWNFCFLTLALYNCTVYFLYVQLGGKVLHLMFLITKFAAITLFSLLVTSPKFFIVYLVKVMGYVRQYHPKVLI